MKHSDEDGRIMDGPVSAFRLFDYDLLAAPYADICDGIASISAPKPLVFVGLPPVANTKHITTTSFSHGSQDEEYNRVTANYLAADNTALRQDFSGQRVRSYDYVYLGDIITLNGKECRVKAVNAKLVDGILEMEYLLAGQTGFVAPQKTNTACSGRILIGQVKEGH